MDKQISNKEVDRIDNTTEIDLVELLYFFRTKIVFLIIAVVLGGTIAGVFTVFFITPKYQSFAKIYMVSASSDSIVDLTDINIGTSLSADYEELLKIRPIFEDVIDTLDIDYTVDELKSMVTIGTINKTRLIQITAESTDPQEATDIANTIADLAVTYIPKVMETATPNIAEAAILPLHKSSPSLAKNTMLGALLLLVVVGGILTLQFVLDDTFKSAEDVEKMFGVMPLAVIPEGEVLEISDKVEEEINKAKKKDRKRKHKG